MPSAGIEYQVNPRAMAYFSYSRGFKAGGVNGELGAVGPPQNFVYGPEYVNAYELGLKSKWFDDTLLLNFDLFRSDYKDLQVNSLYYQPVLNTYLTEVNNAAASRSQGVELETQWAVTKDFRLGANITYLDSHYVDFPNAPAATFQAFCASPGHYVLPDCLQFPNPVPPAANISGQRTNFAPLWSGSITASYSAPLPGGYKFITMLSPYFTSSYFFNNANGNDPALQIGGYIRLDGRLSLEAPGGHWNIDLIGRNLTDRVIDAYIYSQAQASKEQPRNVAVQFRYKY
jgi:outer membrane receptor protein involved in Fe transport